MSKNNQSTIERRERVGDTFDRDLDPLYKYEKKFEQLAADGVDPFELFLDEIIRESNRAVSTVDEWERGIRHFKEFVDDRGRHPACVSDSLVVEFAEYEAYGRGNKASTIKTKLRHVKNAFGYFQDENIFPHDGYNPVVTAWDKIMWPDEEDANYPKVTIEEMRTALNDVTHLFKLTVILMGVKLGMRQGEIRNVKLKDIHIENTELQKHYPSLGTHNRIKDFTNVIYIPNQSQRPGNKSEESRILPLDDEMREVLTQYLLIRPDCGEPWVFLSQTHHEQIRDKDGINRHWREQMRPHIEAADHEKELTSHFGRHWFTTYWKIQQEMKREHVQYMRGDDIGENKEDESIDEYLHTYYLDIEQQYRDEIYKLLL